MKVSSAWAALLTCAACLVQWGSSSDSSSSESPFVELFGSKLYAWDGSRENVVEVDTTEALRGKNTVALYFSASWCGPCRQFTPQLVQFYNSMNKKGKKFEIVLVSGDRTSESFVDYYSKMPWLAVPITVAQQVNAKLGPKYKLKGIPHLVVLDGHDATVYSLDGRTKVAQDKYGLEFPWRPRTLMNLLPRPVASLLKAQIEKVKASLLQLLTGLSDLLAPKRLLKLLLDKVQPQQQQQQGKARKSVKLNA